MNDGSTVKDNERQRHSGRQFRGWGFSALFLDTPVCSSSDGCIIRRAPIRRSPNIRAATGRIPSDDRAEQRRKEGVIVSRTMKTLDMHHDSGVGRAVQTGWNKERRRKRQSRCCKLLLIMQVLKLEAASSGLGATGSHWMTSLYKQSNNRDNRCPK